MTVQIKEQYRATQRLLTLVELITEPIILLCDVVLWRKHLTRRRNIVIGTQLDDVIQTNQITIDISEDITRKVGIQKYRPGAKGSIKQSPCGKCF